MDSNFSFLAIDFPALEKTGYLAEIYLYNDANACIYKMGTFAETMVNYIFELDDLKPPSGTNNTQANKVNILLQKNKIDKEIKSIFDLIRTSRNLAVHDGLDSYELCLTLIERTYTLAVWFMLAYGDDAYAPVPFILPEDISNRDDYANLKDEYEKLSSKMAKIKAAVLSGRIHVHVNPSERRRRMEKASRSIRLSEREVRCIIDEELRKVGWETDTFNLRYSRGTRPGEGRNIAIAEWPTDLTVCKWGYMDYALFAGNKLVGVVEANADRRDIPYAIDNQCREYSMGVKEEHTEYMADTWGEYKVPFLFATNGRAFREQYEKGTGVWFRDARDDANTPRVLQGWIGPQGLLDTLERDIAAENRKLAEASYGPLLEKDGLSLRPYQIEAIEKAESSILDGRRAILLAMAEGTGINRTILGFVYRFLKTGRFKSILFLLDRADIGEQMLDSFKKVKVEGPMTIDQVYDIKALDDINIDMETKIQIATFQDLAQCLLYNDSESMPSVSDYDLIVIDQVNHRYIPDDDASGGQSGQSYSEYRAVIDYFDAVKIAWAAGKEPYVTEIFGEPVFEYTHERAVSEGYLFD